MANIIDNSQYERMLEVRPQLVNLRNDLLNIENEQDINPGDTYTVQHAVNVFGFGWFHVKLSLLVGLCWMADSMEMTILSIMGPVMQCEWNISIFQKALTTTIVFLGMLLSSSFWYQLSNKYGRKPALTLCGGLLVLYGLLSSVAPNYSWMLILRGLVGFSIGCIPQSVTLYAEFLPSKHKGKCVVIMDCFWALGACFEIVLALAVFPTLGWRWLLGLSVTPFLLFTMLTHFLPESPYYHKCNGQNDKAVKILSQIARNNNRHMLSGRLTYDGDNIHPVHIRALFDPALRKTTLALWVIWMSCAFCYYGLVLISAEVVLKTKRKTESSNSCDIFSTTEFMNLLWIAFSEFPGIFWTIISIKRWGKQKTMLIQFLGHAICLMLLTLKNSSVYTTTILFFARGLISGLFQAAYTYTPEVYPSNLRSLGVHGCSTLARLGAMITPFIAQVVIENSLLNTVYIYSLISLLSALICTILPDFNMAMQMPI